MLYFSLSFNIRFTLIGYFETARRSFSQRLIGPDGGLTYHQHLSMLELDSLELRCVRADLLCTYKQTGVWPDRH